MTRLHPEHIKALRALLQCGLRGNDEQVDALCDMALDYARTKVIKTKEQNDEALAEVTMLMAADPQADTPEGERLELLVVLIQDYEHKNYPLTDSQRDTRRLDYFETRADQGGCPALLNDDNGHWAVVENGVQNIAGGQGSIDIATSFWVKADEWKPTVREAIDAALEKDFSEELKT